MPLPDAKFALNLTCLASTGYSPAFTLYSCELLLSFEHTIYSLVNITVASVTDLF